VSQYLEGLAVALRNAGLTVVELAGWETRGRGDNVPYSDGRPWCVLWHHTASAGDGADDADYCTFRSPDAPLTNLVIGREGIVYVCAAGPTNTNGKGGPLTFSRGTVPVDSMNSYAVGIEISNNGVGMPYPTVQIDACFAASNAIAAAYGLEPDDVAEHVDWAPGRKIDPATATAVQGGWQPEPVNSSLSWWVADLRAECRRRATPTPTPIPPIVQEEPDMLALDLGTPGVDPWWTRLTYTGAELVHVVSPADVLQARGKVPVVSVTEPELSALLDSVMTVGPSPFGPGQAPNPGLDAKWTAARGRT
jgi:hypothetical protein